MNDTQRRIIFMGTPSFAVPSLKILHENGYPIVGVITAPDRKGGRGRNKRIVSAVKEYALAHNLMVLQPKNLKSDKFLEELSSLQADLQVVVAFRMLPEVVWGMAPLGTINLHGSMLPAYRGAAPINWAIINGEERTGLTTFFIEKRIDTGHILGTRVVNILPRDTAGTLHDRMMEMGAELVLKTVDQVVNQEFTVTHQDHSKATKAPKIFHEDCEIDFSKSATEIYNFVRGLSPYPAAWTMLDGRKLKIFWLEKHSSEHPGEIGEWRSYENHKLLVRAADGWLEVSEVQMEGRRKMSVETFLRGYDTTISEIKD